MAQMLARPGPNKIPPFQPNKKFAQWMDEQLRSLPNPQELRSFFTDTRLEYNASLDIDCMINKVRMTHIICTIGPASREVPMLLALMKAGMNICRLNFSHGSYDYHEGTVRNIREAATQMPAGFVIAIALDTKGPEIRTGLLEGGPSAEVTLVTGNSITVTTNDHFAERCSAETLWVDYKRMVSALEVGAIIYVDDGLISLKVVSKTHDSLHCSILNGGQLGSKKGCNLPGTPVDLPAVSEKDKQDLLFGLTQDVDMVFASFIQNGDGIREIRGVLGDRGKHIKILAKIESFEGIYNFQDVLQEADGVMVARGDMGIEIPPEKVFVAQKLMISSCNMAGKPVICATQMLESMTAKPRATQAESNDVANAVLDGSDCVMLSGETAKGKYPVEAVTHMSDCCLQAESVFFSFGMYRDLKRITPVFIDASHTVSMAAVDASYQCMAKAILVLSSSGRTAHILSCYRPRCPIVLVTRDAIIARQSLMYRGIVPILYSEPPLEDRDDDLNARIQVAMTFCVSQGFVQHQDNLVVVMGLSSGPGMSNCLQVVSCQHGKPH